MKSSQRERVQLSKLSQGMFWPLPPNSSPPKKTTHAGATTAKTHEPGGLKPGWTAIALDVLGRLVMGLLAASWAWLLHRWGASEEVVVAGSILALLAIPVRLLKLGLR
jgi:hypothetical protein